MADPYTINNLFDGSVPESFAPHSFNDPDPLSNNFADQTLPSTLASGEMQGQTTVQSGYLQSSNFVTGSAGWQINSNGDIEANSGTFRGTITATTGAIGGFDIGADYIRDVANSFGLASTVTGGDDVRFWAGDTFANRATADFRVTEAGAVTATSITLSTSVAITGVTASVSRFLFGGTGADGALSITSGTTTIDASSAELVVKNYTSISITSTGVLGFSNPSTNGTVFFLRSQGDVTITSSTNPCIDVSSMGGTGGAGGASGEKGISWGTYSNAGSVGTASVGDTSAGTGGEGGSALTYILQTVGAIERFSCGGGGAGGTFGGSARGTGGRGGGAIIIECGGALNFTTTVSCAGANGVDATDGSGSQSGSGGGGGGAGGSFAIIYKTLTASSGTITKTGGNGGAGGDGGGGSSDDGGAGGGGGGNVFAGGAGGNGGDNASGSAGSAGGGTGGGTGGAAGVIVGGDAGGGGGGGGSAGVSYIVSNIDFA